MKRPEHRSLTTAVLAGMSLDKEVAGLRNYLYDYRRFKAHSSAFDRGMSDEALAARITKEYHKVEKGLALPEPRPGFGIATIDWLIETVPQLEKRGHAPQVTTAARESVRGWVDWHDAAGIAVRDDIRAFAAGSDGSVPAGVRRLTRAEVSAATALDFDRFARARHSVRQFTGEAVAPEDVRAAVETALKTPRVCNRESRRVHAGFAPEIREKMLSHQSGNRGFGHAAGAVLVVTSDLRYFTAISERNQAWIDGGLFAMSLAFALHGRGARHLHAELVGGVFPRPPDARGPGHRRLRGGDHLHGRRAHARGDARRRLDPSAGRRGTPRPRLNRMRL